MIGVGSARRASPWRSVTIADAFKRAGRLVLWLLVAVLLARGLAGVLARPDRVASASVVRPAAPSWPDDEARAFAVDFARAYLTFSPKDRDSQLRALTAFAASELASSI